MKHGKTSVLKDVWNHKFGRLGILFISIIAISSVIIPILSPYSIDKIDLIDCYSPPSSSHLFGTDELGRDVFTRVFYAGRISILVGVSGTFISVLLGIFIGAVAGYFGGIVDSIFLKLHEVQYCFPAIILVIALMSILNGGTVELILFLGLFMWPTTFRVTRNLFISLKNEDYVKSAKLMGNNSFSIMFKQILPNVFPTITVNATLLVAQMIILEIALSFLGLGVQPPLPSWGNMLNAARDLTVLSEMWWMWVPPGVLVFLFALGINLLGDALNDVISPYYWK